MRRMRSCWLVVAALLCPPAVPAAVPVTVDGNPSEWIAAGVPPLGEDAVGDSGENPDLVRILATDDETFLYLLFEFAAVGDEQIWNKFDLDVDLAAATGCPAYLNNTVYIGAEYSLDLQLPGGFGNGLGDSRDCSWAISDFPGAVTAATSDRYTEVSIALSALNQLSPGGTFTALDISCGFDGCDQTQQRHRYGQILLDDFETGVLGRWSDAVPP